MTAEVLLIILNFVIVLISYFFIYPVFAGRNINKLVVNDCLAMLLSLFIAFTLYGDTRYDFTLVFFETNWFWFSLSTFMLIETPFALRYIKKYKLFEFDEH
jgi:hypothetical protein